MRLWTEDVPIEEIARVTGSTVGSVNTTVSALRRSGVPLPRRRHGPPVISIPVAPDLMTEAEAAAGQRGVSLQELFSRIVLAVLTDRMIDAVLDDGTEKGR